MKHGNAPVPPQRCLASSLGLLPSILMRSIEIVTEDHDKMAFFVTMGKTSLIALPCCLDCRQQVGGEDVAEVEGDAAETPLCLLEMGQQQRGM